MFVYRVGYINQIDSIFKHGYSRQFLGDNEGTDYGDGIYCNIDMRDSLNRLRNTPNGCIFKCEVISNLQGYLIFNGRYAQQVYGGDYSIKNQVELLFGEDAPKVWRDFTNIMQGDVSAREHMHGRTAELLQVLLSPRRIATLKRLLPLEDARRNVRKEYEILFKKHNIKGAIYRGLKDGLCLVAYDFSDCIPVAYSTDGGKTFKERKFDGDKVDVQKKYGLKYKKVDYPITIEGDGQEYQFSRVTKKNGKVNYIDINTGEEFSPVDFDSATLINHDNGMFQIEYKGKFFHACPDGFFDKNEDGHTFDELPNFVVNESELKFENILENAINEVYQRFIGEKPLIKESVLSENQYDEARYGDYDVPTERELDSNDMVSVYHVTQLSDVDSIFKFGCDREFTGKNANVYGAGVYSTITINDSRHLLRNYGGAMMELKIIGGFDRFLIFDRELAKKYYGKNYHILNQLQTMTPPHIAQQLYDKCREDVKSYSKIARNYNIRGAIYPWGGLTAVLPFDFSSVIPYAVSYDGGKTFEKKYNSVTNQRTLTSVDVHYRYGHLYKRISKPIAGYNVDNEPTGFALVLKNNNKYNYIDIQNGEEVSPIDFDSASLMNPENGSFQIEYKGKFFDACLDGFYDKNEDGHTFDELPNFA
jgi:hypothetical protein